MSRNRDHNRKAIRAIAAPVRKQRMQRARAIIMIVTTGLALVILTTACQSVEDDDTVSVVDAQ